MLDKVSYHFYLLPDLIVLFLIHTILWYQNFACAEPLFFVDNG